MLKHVNEGLEIILTLSIHNPPCTIRLNTEKIATKRFIVLSASVGHGVLQKKVSINLTPGEGLICYRINF